MRERDLLVAETMAFVQSVSGHAPAAAAPAVASKPAPAAAAMATIETVLVERTTIEVTTVDRAPAPAPKAPEPAAAYKPFQPIEMVQPYRRGEFQSEISDRIANFRANQQRFIREREEYSNSTMAKVLASLAVPPRAGK